MQDPTDIAKQFLDLQAKWTKLLEGIDVNNEDAVAQTGRQRDLLEGRREELRSLTSLSPERYARAPLPLGKQLVSRGIRNLLLFIDDPGQCRCGLVWQGRI